MFFDADDYLRLRDRVAAAGCDTPILAGVMPVTQIGTIERSEQLSGAPFPPALAARFDRGRRRPGGGPPARHRAGQRDVRAGCSTRACPGIHFITLNRSTATREVWQNLGVGAGRDGLTGRRKLARGRPAELGRVRGRWAALHGGFDPRLATPVVRGWLRLAYVVGLVLGRLRVRPTAVTVAGLVLSAAVPLVARAGGPWACSSAPCWSLLAAVADSVDGAVAVITGRTSRLGYVYDSLADRLGEAAWLARVLAARRAGRWWSPPAASPGCTSTSGPARSPPACARSAWSPSASARPGSSVRGRRPRGRRGRADRPGSPPARSPRRRGLVLPACSARQLLGLSACPAATGDPPAPAIRSGPSRSAPSPARTASRPGAALRTDRRSAADRRRHRSGRLAPL